MASSHKLGRPVGLADTFRVRLNDMRFASPTKRSVTIAGHETSISLEAIFWRGLDAAALEERLPLNALIARIDAERLDSAPPPNLASAIRQWLLARAIDNGGSE